MLHQSLFFDQIEIEKMLVHKLASSGVNFKPKTTIELKLGS